MLIDFQRKVAFVKTRKTGGSTVELILKSAMTGRHWSEFDSVSPWLLEGGTIATPTEKQTPLPRSRAHFFAFRNQIPFRQVKLLRRLRQHSRPQSMAKAIGEREWPNYMKLLPVRNPFALVLSDYFWLNRRIIDPPDFDSFVRTYRPGRVNDVAADEFDETYIVIRQETLVEDLSSVLRVFALDVPEDFPRLKSGFSRGRADDYAGYYSVESRKVIEQKFSKWLEQFGYDF